jgi:hypothetical protein
MTYEAAGFGEVVCKRITTVLEYDRPDSAVGAAFAGGPVAMAYARFDDETREEAHAEYLASIGPPHTARPTVTSPPGAPAAPTETGPAASP